MKTRTCVKTKTKVVSLEGYERRRLTDAMEILTLFSNEGCNEAMNAHGGLALFLEKMTPTSEPRALGFDK